MPKSKRRKKDGKPVGNGAAKREAVLDNMESGVSLQDLINVVAYQDYVQDGTITPPKQTKIDFEDPDTQAVIRAVAAKNKNEEN